MSRTPSPLIASTDIAYPPIRTGPPGKAECASDVPANHTEDVVRIEICHRHQRCIAVEVGGDHPKGHPPAVRIAARRTEKPARAINKEGIETVCGIPHGDRPQVEMFVERMGNGRR